MGQVGYGDWVWQYMLKNILISSFPYVPSKVCGHTLVHFAPPFISDSTVVLGSNDNSGVLICRVEANQEARANGQMNSIWCTDSFSCAQIWQVADPLLSFDCSTLIVGRAFWPTRHRNSLTLGRISRPQIACQNWFGSSWSNPEEASLKVLYPDFTVYMPFFDSVQIRQSGL
jgi:hypothetical protein